MSDELKKKYNKVHLKRELSAFSLSELIQAALWNDSLHKQVNLLKSKLEDFAIIVSYLFILLFIFNCLF